MGRVGCYSLALYCDNADSADDALGHRLGSVAHPRAELQHSYSSEFNGRNEREAVAEAKRAGWKVRRSRAAGFNGPGFAYCPRCVARYGGKYRAVLPTPERER